MELSKQIGKKAIWSPNYKTIPNLDGNLKIEVEIINIDLFAGIPVYTVKPISGSGQARVRDNIEVLQ